jgi:NAD(P)-dependent dehydrogenase (short-subunit alcohol dehydrogenase family)
MQQDLHGKVALVTGSAHRVGKAIALELARQGCHQVVHYFGSSEKAEQTVREIQALNVEAQSFRANMGNPAEIEALFGALDARFGRLDILINSAGVFDPGDFINVTLEAWQRTIDVNLTAPFLCTQYAARLMRRGGQGGAIVNISDMGGLRGSPDYPQHSIAKAGILMMTNVAARALAPDIRVNAVVPGMVLQPPDFSDAAWKQMAQKMPIQRDGSAEDVARTVAYLVREDYLTGTVITVDGGEHLI